MVTENKTKLMAALAERIVEQMCYEIGEIQLVSKAQAAKLMGVSEATVERLCLPRIKMEEGQTGAARYRISDIKKIIAARTVERKKA